jgi:hypothetical protein
MRGRNTTTVTARVKQAAASTHKLYHAHAGLPTPESGEETPALEFSVYTTIFLAMIVVALGAGMAIIFFKINYPDCLNGSFDASNVSSQVRRMLRGTGSALDGLMTQVDLGFR